jgi:hypothetical protein
VSNKSSGDLGGGSITSEGQSDDKYLKADGAGGVVWAVATGSGGVTDLDDLSDVGSVTYTNRHVLVADGADYDSRALVEADISNLGSYALAAHNHDSTYQPLDSDLTAVAALATTSYGRSVLTLADAAAARSYIGSVIGTNVQAYSAVLAATTASFTTGDETKLDGIEALADVTDAANVNTAGAAMVSTGAGAPGSAPAKPGNIYVDTTNDLTYIAVDTATAADWKNVVYQGQQTVALGLTLTGAGGYLILPQGSSSVEGNANWDASTDVLKIGDGAATLSFTPTLSGSGAPGSVPKAVGNTYVDTTNDVFYMASGTSGAGDWDRLGDLVASNNLSEVDPAAARTQLGVDPAGTDNSTNVSLSGTPDYITIAGQVITRGLIDMATDTTGLLGIGQGGTGSSSAATARTALGVDPIGTDNAPTASDTTAGKIELATISEVNTGTDGVRAVTPDTLFDANYRPNITTGAGAPSGTPTKRGDIYVNTTDDNVFIAGDTTSSDWKQVSGAGGGDMLKSENLTGLANYTTARSNLSLTPGTNVQAWSQPLQDITGLGTPDAGDTIVGDGANWLERKMWESGAGVPGSTPERVGAIYADTTNDVLYFATGTTNAADWIEIDAGGATVLADLTDVNVTTPTAGNVLRADGTDWESTTLGLVDLGDVSAAVQTSGFVVASSGGQYAGRALVSGDLPSHTHTLANISDDGALAALNTVGTTQIDNDAVTYAKLQNVAANSILGNNTGGSTDAVALNATDTKTLLALNNVINVDVTSETGTGTPVGVVTPSHRGDTYRDTTPTPDQMWIANGATSSDWVKISGLAAGDITGLDAAVTLAGTPDYITIAGQVITRNQIDLATDITGTLPVGNLGTDAVTTVKILNSNVTLAKLADIATDSFIGRVTPSTGVPEVLSLATVRTMLTVPESASGEATAVISNGTTSTIVIAHGLTGTPTYATVTPSNSSASLAPSYYVVVDSTNVTITFDAFLENGTTCTYWWRAEV